MIERSTQDGVAYLALHHPPLNILNQKLIAQLHTELTALAEDPRTRVVVLSSKIPRVFSAGADVGEHLPPDFRTMIESFVDLCGRLVTYPKPTLAAVDGKCLGGGLELALSCDLVLATEGAQFGQPEVAVGVFPPVGAALYPRICGLQNAYRLLLDPRPVSALEAQRMGAVSQVVAEGKLESTVAATATVLARSSLAVLGLAKRAIREGLAVHWGEARARATRLYLEDLMSTEDATEGLRAFLEKRPARWKDR